MRNDPQWRDVCVTAAAVAVVRGGRGNLRADRNALARHAVQGRAAGGADDNSGRRRDRKTARETRAFDSTIAVRFARTPVRPVSVAPGRYAYRVFPLRPVCAAAALYVIWPVFI